MEFNKPCSAKSRLKEITAWKYLGGLKNPMAQRCGAAQRLTWKSGDEGMETTSTRLGLTEGVAAAEGDRRG